MGYRFLKTIKFNFDFGTLLSVDFSSCSKDSDLFDQTEEIINEIKDSVQNRGFPDFIWLKGIGDSLKYANCKEIIDMIKEIYPNQKIGIYLNCSLFKDENIRKNFYGCDLVAINLNTVDLINFSKINKCPKAVKCIEILEGIKKFREEFTGNLGIYTLFLKGINDNLKTIENLKNYLLEVMPDHYSVSNYTLDGFEPVSDEFKKEVENILRDLPFKIIYMF